MFFIILLPTVRKCHPEIPLYICVQQENKFLPAEFFIFISVYKNIIFMNLYNFMGCLLIGLLQHILSGTDKMMKFE